MASRFSQSSMAVSNHLEECSNAEEASSATSKAYLPQTIVLCDLRHEAFEGCVPSGPSDSGLVSKWRPKDRVSSFSHCVNKFCYGLLLWFVENVELWLTKINPNNPCSKTCDIRFT